MRKILLLCLLLSACGNSQPSVAPTATPSPSASPSPAPTPDQGIFRNSNAIAHTRTLSVDVGLRNAGSSGDREAASWIASRVRELGWRVDQQPFPLPQGGTSTNVIGTPPGFDDSKPYLIVGGHFDSLRGPGANDNATGIGVALEIARALTARPAAFPTRFIAFGAEEVQPVPGRHHHVGSRFYVAHMSAEAKRNLVAYVNVDMVGVGPVLFCVRMSVGPREGTRRCVQKGAELGIRAFERVTPDWSDNGSFLRAGMNAAALWTGDQPCCNHSPRDTFDRVQPDAVERAGLLALAILRSYNR